MFVIWRSRLWALAILLSEKYTWALIYPGVGAFRSSSQNGYLGAYPGVGACPGDYGIYMCNAWQLSKVGGERQQVFRGRVGEIPFSPHTLNETLLCLYEGVYSTTDVKHTSAQIQVGGPINFI